MDIQLDFVKLSYLFSFVDNRLSKGWHNVTASRNGEQAICTISARFRGGMKLQHARPLARVYFLLWSALPTADAFLVCGKLSRC